MPGGDERSAQDLLLRSILAAQEHARRDRLLPPTGTVEQTFSNPAGPMLLSDQAKWQAAQGAPTEMALPEEEQPAESWLGRRLQDFEGILTDPDEDEKNVIRPLGWKPPRY